MTNLSRRGIIKALSGLDGRYIERIPGGPCSRNSYRLLDDGVACEAHPVAINGSARQAFNPTCLSPTPTMWPPAASATAVSQPVQRQPEAFSVNPSISQVLGVGRPVALSSAGAEPVTAQSNERPAEATPFVQSVGHPITPTSLAALLAQPVVWQQVKQLAETILAIQPGMVGDSPATPTNPATPMSEPRSESPPIQRQTESISPPQSVSQPIGPDNPVAMSASVSPPVAVSPPIQCQPASVSLAQSASSGVTLASPVAMPTLASELVVASPVSPDQAKTLKNTHLGSQRVTPVSPSGVTVSASESVVASQPGQQAESVASAPSDKQAMRPTSASVLPASPPAPASTATRINTSPPVSEPTERDANQRQPERFRGKSFDQFQAVTPKQQQILGTCRTYAERVAADRGQGANLLMLGGPGTGKTHLSCAILAHAIRGGRTGLFISVSAALRLVRESFGPHAQRTESEALALLIQPDVLVLDEAGIGIGKDEKRPAINDSDRQSDG